MSLRTVQGLQYVLSLFEEAPDHAASLHAKLLIHLATHGYRPRAEHPVTYGEREGRVDIRALCPATDMPIGIEIDARKPRKNSIKKLNVMFREERALRVVCLRGVNGPAHSIEGVDMVYPLPVRMLGCEPKGSVKQASRAVAK